MNAPVATVYLDVDGVIAATAYRVPEQYATGNWGATRLFYRTRVITGLNELAAGALRFCWVSNWMDEAPALAEQLGLQGQHWPVLTGDQHAHRGEDWWKWQAVREHQQAAPTGFVWIDNDLAAESHAVDWALGTGRGGCLSPDPVVGIDDWSMRLLRRLALGRMSPSQLPIPRREGLE